MTPSIHDTTPGFGLSDQDMRVLAAALARSEQALIGATPVAVIPTETRRQAGMLHQIELRLGSVV